ncbi:MAG TPA: ABC transporter permease [Stellaceae bacterium]|nr:ABC transporter permease [Stellaceae bacterium]
MKAPGNAVLLVLVVAGAIALASLGFVAHAPNRLVSGTPLTLWQAAGAPRAATIAALGAALLAAAFPAPGRRLGGATLVVASLLLLLLIESAGAAAASLAAGAPKAARTALGPAFWIAGLCIAFAVLDALQRLAAGPALRLGTVAALVALAAALTLSGRLDQLSLLREFANERADFLGELLRHCELVAGAVVPALLIGIPVGLLAAQRERSRAPIFAALNVVQTIPSIALFGLLIAPLAALGVGGIGMAPALIALTLYALLPVARNTLAGLLGVDPAVIESAAGMGMTRRQIFWRVELPLGMPVLLAGVRVVVVQAIGLAVVAALVGAGGLGSFVFRGIGQYAIDLVLLGALPAIALALAADFAMALAIDWLGRRAR